MLTANNAQYARCVAVYCFSDRRILVRDSSDGNYGVERVQIALGFGMVCGVDDDFAPLPVDERLAIAAYRDRQRA